MKRHQDAIYNAISLQFYGHFILTTLAEIDLIRGFVAR